MQYAADSAPALALQATIEKTEKRFANYGRQGLLCGTDGLPHLIADPGLALRYGHAGDIFVSARAGRGARQLLLQMLPRRRPPSRPCSPPAPHHTHPHPHTDPHHRLPLLCRLDWLLWLQVPAGRGHQRQAD